MHPHITRVLLQVVYFIELFQINDHNSLPNDINEVILCYLVSHLENSIAKGFTIMEIVIGFDSRLGIIFIK